MKKIKYILLDCVSKHFYTCFLVLLFAIYGDSSHSCRGMTRLDELTEQPSWAMTAIQTLSQKYQISTFLFPNRITTTRPDLALALQTILATLGFSNFSSLADKTDIDTLAMLEYDFRNELARLKEETSRLESRMNAVEAKTEE